MDETSADQRVVLIASFANRFRGFRDFALRDDFQKISSSVRASKAPQMRVFQSIKRVDL